MTKCLHNRGDVFAKMSKWIRQISCKRLNNIWYNYNMNGEKINVASEVVEAKKRPGDGILPYLTINKLSELEIEQILDFASTESAAESYKNKFAYQDFLERSLSEIIGEESSGSVSPKEAEARKLFSASLFETINVADSPEKTWQVYEKFFSLSPNISSYVGGLSGTLELLSIAERSDKNPCARELCGEIIYNESFGERNGFQELLSEQSPIKQAQLMPIIFNVAGQCHPDDWSAPVLGKASEAFYALEDSSETTPFVKILARSLNQKIDETINAEWIDIDPNDSQYAELIADSEQKHKVYLAEQAELHRMFPSLPSEQSIIKVAPGVVASVNQSARVNTIADANGRQMSLLSYEKDNDFGIDQDAAYLIGMAHNQDIKALIDEELGIDLADIEFDAQVQLLKYMTEAEGDRYDKLRQSLNTVSDKLKIKLANGFLAADFGEDFGDALLDIAESDKISDEQLGEILDNVDSCRKSIGRIANLYTGYQDGEFSKEYARAANERLTDAIMAFREIGKMGEANAELGWFGEASLDYDSAVEALEYETQSLEIISGTMNDVREGKSGAFAEKILTPDEFHTRTMYNFYSPEHGYVLLYTRPEGSHSFEPMLEYGKVRSRYSEVSNNGGVEASISFIVNPVDPFALPNPFRPDRNKIKDAAYYDSGTMDKVSAIRIDREGRAPGAAADDPNRDPISEDGTVSVDLAAINDRMDTPSGKIARLFSIGNKIRNTNNGKFSLNHNTNWFNQDRYGTASGFKDLVDYLDGQMSELCAKYPPDKKEGFAGARRELRRRRGRMVRRVA